MTHDQTAAVPAADEGASATGRQGDDRDDTAGQIMLQPADLIPPAMQSVRRSTAKGRTDVIKVMGNTKWT